ncbi:MAG: MFS transporter [Armatimonadota bacterium]|nr:MAG: MFS transporter [Armatimonadota bacterium]
MMIWRTIPDTSRRALKWDATAALLGGLYLGALFPFLGVIARRDLHASPYLIALLGAGGSVGNLFTPLMAHHIRRRAKLPYVVWPWLVSRSIFLLMPLAVFAPTFVAICFLALAISALAGPAYAAVIRDAYPMERRGFLMGLVRVLAVAGSIVGALVAGSMLDRISFRWVFPAATLLGIAGVALFARIGVATKPDESSPPQAHPWDAFGLLITDRPFRIYAAGFFLYGLGNLILGPVIPVFQVDELAITSQWVGYLATVGAALSMIGYVWWGRVLDRKGPFRLLLMVIAVSAIAPLTYFLSHSVPVLLIAAAAQGFAMAGGDLGFVNAALRFGTRDAVPSYAGMFSFLQAVRGIPGPFIGAALSHAIGPRNVFPITLCLWAISALILFAGRRARLRSMENE